MREDDFSDLIDEVILVGAFMDWGRKLRLF